jgi:hypothetical protein
VAGLHRASLHERVGRRFALSEGRSPKQRDMATVSKVMRRLGYASFVMAGSGTPPIVERILAIHRSLYRPSDLAVGGIHGGIFMFRDVFARISIPFGYGQMSVDPFQLTDLSESQLRWLGSRPQDMAVFWTSSSIFSILLAPSADWGLQDAPSGSSGDISTRFIPVAGGICRVERGLRFSRSRPSCLIGAELSLKAGLAAQGASEEARRKHGHDLASAAKAFSTGSPAFDLDRVLRTVGRLPQYVENR